jgi:hypothetical protein
VPIVQLLRNGHFTPEDITALTVAFENALLTLGINDRTHPTVLLVAKRVIEVARQGERDPATLGTAVLESFKQEPGVSGM